MIRIEGKTGDRLIRELEESKVGGLHLRVCEECGVKGTRHPRDNAPTVMTKRDPRGGNMTVCYECQREVAEKASLTSF